MSLEWQKNDEEIGKLIEKYGIEGFNGWPIIRRTMLFGGSLETNGAQQRRHYQWIQDTGTFWNNVVEIGAGVGQLAEYFLQHDNVYIVDLPNISKIQRHRIPDAYHEEIPENLIGMNTLVVAMWSMSEMDREEREALLKKYWNCQWFIGFQERHLEYNNLDWFLGMAIKTKRRFIMQPVAGLKGQWYLFVDF